MGRRNKRENSNMTSHILPNDVARYFFARSTTDGELITPLKMQKLVYYAYVWHLVKKRKKLFHEKIEAWANGPVTPSLYHELKQFGAAPITNEFLSTEEMEGIIGKLPSEAKETLDQVYDKYMTLTAFELVMLTHGEKPWLEARRGLKANEPSTNPISDKQILEFYRGRV